jgi:hypothetical protein
MKAVHLFSSKKSKTSCETTKKEKKSTNSGGDIGYIKSRLCLSMLGIVLVGKRV